VCVACHAGIAIPAAMETWSSLGGNVNPKDKVFSLLLDYCAFCHLMLKHIPQIGLMWVTTPVGSFSCHQASAMFWLGVLRYQKGNQRPLVENIARRTKRLQSMFSELKRGMIESCMFQASELPEWVHRPAGQEPWIKKIFDAWFKEDPDVSAKPRAQLTKEHICFWAMYILGLWMLEPPENIQELILYALLLRVQSGSNSRTGSLTETKWSEVGISDDGTPWVTIFCYKPFALSSQSKKAKLKKATTMYLTDVLSRTLFNIWWGWNKPSEEEMASLHFFPIVNLSGFQFKRPLSGENHAEACHMVGLHWGLVSSPDLKFTSQCVRRGNGTWTYSIVRDILHMTNPVNGRAKLSMQDFNYCGDDAILASGPLFTDVADIQHAYNDFLCDALDFHKNELLCKACGFPKPCGGKGRCYKCEALCAGKPYHRMHTCWLHEMFSTHKVRKPSKKEGYPMKPHQQAAMEQAWLDHGVESIPKWACLPHHAAVKSMGGYMWPSATADDIPQ